MLRTKLLKSFPDLNWRMFRRGASRKISALVASAVFLLTVNSGMSGTFDDALDAARRGDYAVALRLWLPMAQQGDPSAQNNVAQMYAQGHGVTQDYAQALHWWRKAASSGLVDAENSIGFSYHEGIGVAQDFTEAANWYRRAAEKGHALAQANLGAAYGSGQGVPQDWTQSTYWYSKSAAQGNPRAQTNLGVAYANGQGVPRDFVQAYKWYMLALAGLPDSDTEGRNIARGNLARLTPLMTPNQIADARKLVEAAAAQ
jgi:TPR repeat protein